MRTLTALSIAAALLFGIRYVSDTAYAAFALRPEHAESTVGLEELPQTLKPPSDFSKPAGYLVEWPPGLFLENEDGSPEYPLSEYPSLLQGPDEPTSPERGSIYKLIKGRLYRIDAQTGRVKAEGPRGVVRFALHVDGKFLFAEQEFHIAAENREGQTWESKFLRLDPLTLAPLAAGSLDYWVPGGQRVATHWDIITSEFVALKLTYSWNDRKAKSRRETTRYLRFVPVEELWERLIAKTSAFTYLNRTIFFILQKELQTLPEEPLSFAQQFQDRFKVPARVVLNRLSEEGYSFPLWDDRFRQILPYFDPIRNLPVPVGEPSLSTEGLPRPAGEAAAPDTVALPRAAKAEGSSSDAGLEEDRKKGRPRLTRRGFLKVGGGIPGLMPSSLSASNPSVQIAASEILAEHPDVAHVYYGAVRALAETKKALTGSSPGTQNLFILINRWRLGELAEAWNLWQEKVSTLGEKDEWAPVLSEMRSFEEEYRRKVASYGGQISDPSLGSRTIGILTAGFAGGRGTFQRRLIDLVSGHLLDQNLPYLREAATECARYGATLDFDEKGLSETASIKAMHGVMSALRPQGSVDPSDKGRYDNWSHVAIREYIDRRVSNVLFRRYENIVWSAFKEARRRFAPPERPGEIRLGPDPAQGTAQGTALYPFEHFRERPQGFGIRVFVAEMKRRLHDQKQEPHSDQTPEGKEVTHLIEALPRRVLIRTKNPSGLFTQIKNWLHERPRPTVSRKLDQQPPLPAASSEGPSSSLSEELPEGPLPFLWPGKGNHVLREKFLLFAPEGWRQALGGLFTEEQRGLVQIEPLEELAGNPVDSAAVVLLDVDEAQSLPEQHPLVLELHFGELSTLTPDLLSYLAHQAKLRDRVLLWTADSAKPVTWEGRDYLLFWKSA